MPMETTGEGQRQSERWVSAEETAAHVGVRKDSIYRWIETRGLPATKIGKLWKLKLSEVDRWMRAGGARADDDGSAAGGTDGANPSTVRPGPILIVDDELDARETLRDVVADQGYATLTAADGLEALKLLRSGGQRPDLIFLDLAMPNMDGLAFLEEQRHDPKLAAIPVVIVTGGKANESSAEPVLRKPLDIAKVLDSIRRIVRS